MKRGVRMVVAGLIVGGSAGVARADAAGDAKKAVEQFFAAVQAGDEKAVKAAVAATKEQEPAVQAYLDLMIATTQLQKAAVSKFGSAAESTFGGAAASVEARLKAVQEATPKAVGDSVLLTVAGDESKKVPTLTLVMRKTEGVWRIDGGSLFNLTPENRVETRERAALSVKLTTITRQMTQEINDGKYAAAVDAFQEFWSRSVKAAKDGGAAPATQSVEPKR
jgi:hypothetical protein